MGEDSFEFLVSSFEFLVSSFEFLVSSFESLVLVSSCQLSYVVILSEREGA